MNNHITIVWFKQDLRLEDNPALNAAAQNGEVIPIFIYDTSVPNYAQLGGASKWWLHQSLQHLNEKLDGKLICLSGKPSLILPQLVQDICATHVVWNRTYEPWQMARDKNIKTELKSNGIGCVSYNGSLLWEPWTINKPNGEPYKVFTPYYRRGCLGASAPRYPLRCPEKLIIADVNVRDKVDISDLNLLPTLNWYKNFGDSFVPGEVGAKEKLSDFLTQAVSQYKTQRDVPSIKGTSMLSSHLHWGEISPNQIWYAVLDRFGGMAQEGVDVFLSEIGWREFSYYLLFHFPELHNKNYSEKFDRFPWLNNEADIIAWQKGKTGIPIIDAGMRQLWQTGYMHNRVRMVVASFLIKNLLVDWRHGERWFWDCLCDADLASNSASWQWVAGCGADAAPYFRIFNPVLQGEKFDKDGTFVRQYCPELAHMPDKYIHKPWEAPLDILNVAQVSLGDNYPLPIVELKGSRQRALTALKRVNEK
ncbi:deoxyribodipyrimidine photo-lyase [Alteromonas sp. 5E99-2]|uniref:cryptochrome/photolyase family protein n=1 Tax=Alteromonas sp. 5E99-2 TaxID=2817683 RepID=UPI001A9893B4|nr:deoxyribodipyrimidine photo-lyase [Alteromonas sp. 5E99-2]MBO1255020.1 deoxyribodipyrimidine photo-lyase [Alteromonas sp. 5E99-2]